MMALIGLATEQTTAQEVDALAVRAEFIAELSVPGELDHFKRPGRVFYDRAAGELYVADQGNNRLVVFDRQGTYRFEFTMGSGVGSITDFAVSPLGYIYVLGTTREGQKLLKYDFDGLLLGELVPGGISLSSMKVMSVAIDPNDRIYLLDVSVPRVLRITSDGSLDAEWTILDRLRKDERREVVFGSITATGDGLLVPISSLGMLYRYNTDGEHIRTYGYKGSTTGELSFPVSAAVSGTGLIVVLDKQRFNVSCFAPEGRFIGEFGGKGINPGWFYYPTFLAADEADQVYVGQIYNNRVQICGVPESISRRYKKQQENFGAQLPATNERHRAHLDTATEEPRNNLSANHQVTGKLKPLSTQGGK